MLGFNQCGITKAALSLYPMVYSDEPYDATSFAKYIMLQELSARVNQTFRNTHQHIRRGCHNYRYGFDSASALPKLPCTNELPQLAVCCIKENQDLISEILEKTFCFFVCLLDRERFTILVQQPLVFLWACFH